MLKVTGLCKNYGSFAAVGNLNFSVKKGEVFGFLGPNGAGKTTTMKIITGFIPMSKGEVLVGGKDILQNSIETKQSIGYLPETTPLYTDMFVEEYLIYIGKLRGLSGDMLKNQMNKMIEVCGLEEMRTKSVGHLSKGYRQRTGLAQAMIHEPDLLILDEPMSGLDPNQIIEIRGLIKEIGKEKAVVYCSHILSEVTATCNRILIINNGIEAASGTPEEVVAKFQAQMSYDVVINAEEKDMREKLEKISYVKSVAQLSKDGNYNHIKIKTDSNIDIGEEIFDCAVQNGWKIRQLTPKSESLEDVFAKLTKADKKETEENK